MKESPQSKKLDEMLRSSKLAAGGFMGHDSRSVYEIIDNDLAIISESGYTKEQVAARMHEITNKAIELLGNWEEIDEKLLARVDEAKGSLVCPWPHSGRYAKRVTYVKSIETDETIQWSDLNIHFIEEHGFFEGKGAYFRIEPKELIKIIF
ncbi:MAG: hypothetical protein JXA96_15220 [Sedimentisphaerales bacterium]|nr:hypothetical protein [Sedimentisphaerales bacterium]